jgi:RNA recognition motif-containing protein
MPGYSQSQNTSQTSSKLLVSNLPLSFDEDSIYKFLKTFGKIKSLEVIKDAMSGQYLVEIF